MIRRDPLKKKPRDPLHEYCFGHQTFDFEYERGSMFRKLQLRALSERSWGKLGPHEEVHVDDPDNPRDRFVPGRGMVSPEVLYDEIRQRKYPMSVD